MASSSSSSVASMPLKGKLNQVSYLLEDANKRIQEEASKYEIFTTKTSASTHHHQQGKNNNINKNGNATGTLPTDLIRTMSDISTLKSVLCCPIFNQIVNVTDSLDKLSYQLNLHPSIGPADINIDDNGELILAPPIEPASLNNLINSKLDEYSGQANNSPRIAGSNMVKPADIRHDANFVDDQQQAHLRLADPTNYSTNNSSDRNNGFAAQKQDQQNHIMQQSQQKYASQEKIHQQQSTPQSHVPSADLIPSPLNTYDTEKLVLNGKTHLNNNNSNNKPTKRHHQAKISSETSSASVDGEGHRLYKSNGHPELDFTDSYQVYDFLANSANLNIVATDSQFMNREGEEEEEEEEGGRNGYSNELYKSTHELTHKSENVAMEHHQIPTQLNGQIHVTQSSTNNNSNGTSQHTKNTQSHFTGPNGKSIQSSGGVQYNRGSCSPSTSAGSTVRLADECDSGASSYQSQTVKGIGTPYSSYPYKSNEQINVVESRVTSSTPTQAAKNAPIDDKVESIEHELVPDMQRIEVTLEKDENGLGIEIAGYTCEKEEISGIFIKSVTPNTPAGRSGKIRSLDQIFAVNGREILGYSNPEALNFLRRTGKTVTLELMRYIAESKYRKLQTALSRAKPSLSSEASSSLSPIPPETDVASVQNNSTNVIASPTKSSIPISKLRESNLSPTKQTLVQVNNSNTCGQVTPQRELAHKVGVALNGATSVLNKSAVGPLAGDRSTLNQAPITYRDEPETTNQSQIPVAAQRGGTNKVIETKQGARNTIDIRSPAGYTAATANYVKKVAELEFAEATRESLTAQLQKEASDEFGRLVRSEEPEWEKDAQIIEIYKDASQGLGFTVKEYANPKDPKQTIIMITSITPDGIAERDGRLSFGDLLIFVDDTDLKGASLTETVKALKKTNGQVRLGVRKLKRA